MSAAISTAVRGGRREKILEQTLNIVGEKGYHGFGIQELAARCGLTKPGLLHHFGTKEQLLIALLQERDEADRTAVAELYLSDYEAAATPAQQRHVLVRSLRAVIERSIASPELCRLDVVLRAEAINPQHPAHDFYARREREVRSRLAQRTASLCDDPDSAARRILALMAGLQEQWLREAEGFDLLAEWDRAIAQVLPEPSGPN